MQNDQFEKAFHTFIAEQSRFVQYMHDGLESALANQPIKGAEAPAKKSKQVIEIAAYVGEKKKILIVDDAEINRLLMGHFFKNAPVTLEFANCGEQALEKIKGHSFDAILMDLQMKNMGGVETIRAIRNAQPENVKKTQILAITNQEPSDVEKSEAMSAGSNEYFSKSLPREELKQRVFSALNLSV